MRKYPDSPVHTLSDSLQIYFFHPDRFAVEFAGYEWKEAVSGKKSKSRYVWTGPKTQTAWKRVNYRGKLTVWSWSLVRSSGFELSSCLTSLLIITCWWNQRKSKPFLFYSCSILPKALLKNHITPLRCSGKNCSGENLCTFLCGQEYRSETQDSIKRENQHQKNNTFVSIKKTWEERRAL